MPLVTRRRSWISVLLAGLALIGLAATARAQSSTGPDFSNVSDILQGRRILYPVDDIVLGYNGGNQPTTTWVLTTTNGNISGGSSYTASATPAAQNFVVAAARMFNLPRAVVVTPFEGTTNVHDQVAGSTQSFSNPVTPSLTPAMYVVTDLVGNGYESIVFIGAVPFAPEPGVSGGAIGTIVAANVDDPSQGFFYGTPAPLPAQTLVDTLTGASPRATSTATARTRSPWRSSAPARSPAPAPTSAWRSTSAA